MKRSRWPRARAVVAAAADLAAAAVDAAALVADVAVAVAIVAIAETAGNPLARDDLSQVDGVVTDVLAGGNFSVRLAAGQVITAKLSGRLRKFHIRVILGDRVTVGVSPYDPTHGLILQRQKAESTYQGGGPRRR